MLENVPRYDMKMPPRRQALRALIWLFSLPAIISHRNRLKKIGMEGIKPPYLLLCNHNAFMDFMVASKATFPHRVNYVVAIDGFIGREALMRIIGCICKRKFTNDLSLIRQLVTVIGHGDIAAVYPEARYSLCGTTAVLPESLGKLAKLLKVPVVTLICHGHHVNSPFWDLPSRKIKGTEAEMTCIANSDEVSALSVEELNERIDKAFRYDDWAWLKNHPSAKITYRNRAHDLHKILYQCPSCKAEFRMLGKGASIECTACKKKWEMDEKGELHALSGETEFSHIPDWYEWERANVRKEVLEGTYSFSCKARVDSLPNAKGYINLGEASLTHDMSGFTLKGNENGSPYEVHLPAADTYSVHIEYEYLGKYGDCVDLNTPNDTLYVYPKECLFSVTKMSLATEELYDFYHKKHE